MEPMMSYRRKPMALTLATLALAMFVIAACTPNVIRGRPPFVSLSGLNLADDRLNAEIRFSNQNGVPMTISATEIAVTVRDTDLLRHGRPLDLPIGTAKSTLSYGLGVLRRQLNEP